jgi:hypothetical protein
MKRNFHSNLAFTDLLFNTLLCFVVFFTIAVIQMKKTDSVTNINFDGYILIIVDWPSNFQDDVDLYVEDPNSEIIFFNGKSNKVMHLDRDDQGKVGDVSPENREIATIRVPIKGEYIVNVHLYSKWEDLPVPVSVKIYNLKSKTVLLERNLMLEAHGNEKTVCRFTLDEKGKVLEVNDLPKPMVKRLMQRDF